MAGRINMLFLQEALCFAGKGLSVLLAILLLRDGRAYPAAYVGAALFLCSIGYSLTLLPPPLRLSDPWYAIAAAINLPTLGLNLLFARALLTDNFHVDWKAWAALIGLTIAMFASGQPLLGIEAQRQDLADVVVGISGVLVMLHILWIAIAGFGNDLVQARRRLRVLLVLFSLGSFAIISVIELRGMSIVAEGIVFDASTVVITLGLLLWLTRMDTAQLFADNQKRSTPDRKTPSSAVIEEDRRKLNTAMETEEIWRREDLTVTAFGSHVGMAEHQVRTLINSQLGFKNFSMFLNGYRIDAARRAMTDPVTARLPILSIAMDSGFRSLSTFNRAFKSIEGVTPSEFGAMTRA